MFVLKKYLGSLANPLSLCCALLLLGLTLLWFSRRQRSGKLLATMGTLLLLLISTGPGSDLLLSPLESEYPPLRDPTSPPRAESGNLRWVVVLGGGYAELPGVAASTRLGTASLSRLVEGIRVHKLLPGSKLVLLGESQAYADDLVETARTLGADKDSLVVLKGAKDTWAETGLLHELIGDNEMVLVTSASHMPRSVMLCWDRGLQPLPAPTNYLIGPTSGYHYWLPSHDSVLRSERAFYEYLGYAWHRLTR